MKKKLFVVFAVVVFIGVALVFHNVRQDTREPEVDLELVDLEANVKQDTREPEVNLEELMDLEAIDTGLMYLRARIASFQKTLLRMEQRYNEMSEREKRDMEELREHKIFLKKMAESNYMVVEGKLIRICEERELTPIEAKEMKIISSALDATIKGGIPPPDGARVIVQSDKNRHVVTFDAKLPPGARGPSFSIKIIIDAKTGEILQRIIGK